MGKITKIKEVAIDALKPYERNAKLHSEAQVEKIAKSIREFGFLSPCLIDTEGNVIAGHGRIMAAKTLGMETVPCVYIEGLTDAQRRAYILADNRLTELGGWDMQTVSDELERLRQDGFEIGVTGFSIDDIQISDDMGAETADLPEAEPDTEPQVKRGEVWKLGDHRLMCGDSTNAADVAKLAGGGTVDLLVTDPPYGVSYDKGVDTIENDDLQDEALEAFLAAAFENASKLMKPGAAFYVWHAFTKQSTVFDACHTAGLTVKQVVVWVKNQFVLGRQDYQWRHEPCLYGWKEGAAHYFIGLRSLTTVTDKDYESMSKEELVNALKQWSDATTVWYEDKPSVSAEHPTMKPIPLIERCVRNSSREGETVLDLFGGSGTTLLAAEQLNRRCLMMEYDPHYCDVIIARWEKLTGEKAVRL